MTIPIRQAIRAADYSKAYKLHEAFRAEHTYPDVRMLNAELSEHLGDAWTKYRHWLMYVKSSAPPEQEEFITEQLQNNFKNKVKLVEALKEANFGANMFNILLTKGWMMSLPNPLLVGCTGNRGGNESIYASTTQLMKQAYTDKLTYEVEAGCVVWWHGIHIDDIEPHHKDLIGPATTILNSEVSFHIQDKKSKGSMHLTWLDEGVSATVIKMPENIVSFWGTGA